MTAKHLMGTKAGRALLSLLVLAVLALALQSLVFSDATFNATSSSASNIFTSGTLTHTNSMADQVVVNAAGLRPGQSRNGTVLITGGGDGPGTYTLTPANLTDVPSPPSTARLSETLILQIDDVTSGSTRLYRNTVANLSTITLGTIAPGQQRSYLFTLELPTTASSSLQGAGMAMILQFTGVSE